MKKKFIAFAICFVMVIGVLSIASYAVVSTDDGGDHNYYWTYELPTCVDGGKHILVCLNNCGFDAGYYNPGEPALGHNYYWIYEPPTCVDEGKHILICLRGCGFDSGYYNPGDPALGHELIDTGVIQEQTCTQDGIYATECTRCGETGERILPAGHAYYWIYEPPTCTEEGKHILICTRNCGFDAGYYNPGAPALGHDYIEGIVTLEPTCTQGGIREDVCSRCGDVDEVIIPALGHAYYWIYEPPTCTEEGKHIQICTRNCGFDAGYYNPGAPALGHDYIEGIVTLEPTCTQGGIREDVCSRCNDVVEVTITALGHALYWETYPATCTEMGKTRLECTRVGCGWNAGYFNNVPSLPALGHNFVDTGIVILAPTCTQTGSNKTECSRCGEFGEIVVPVLGHALYWKTYPATCTEMGKTRLECTRVGCGWNAGYFNNVPSLPALGHNYIVTDDCYCDGDNHYKISTCTRCADNKQELLWPCDCPTPIVMPTGFKFNSSGDLEIIKTAIGISDLPANGKDVIITFTDAKGKVTTLGVNSDVNFYNDGLTIKLKVIKVGTYKITYKTNTFTFMIVSLNGNNSVITIP